jgi:hypothetical protein
MEAIDYPIVREELAIAASNVAFGLLLAVVVGLAVDVWWLVVPTAAVVGVVSAANDRGRGGAQATYAVVVVGVVGVGGLLALGQLSLSTLPLFVVGAGLGFGANRALFGVVRPVPQVRRDRELE